MKSLLSVLLLIPVLSWAGATEDLLERLQKLDNLRGGFTQMVLDQGGTHMQEADGTMQVARGNRFYWHTQNPFEQIAVSDGDQVWVYDVDLEQAVVRPLSQDLSETPALLFGGEPDKVASAFEISEQDRNADQVTYRLEPKGDDPLFDQLEVTFQGGKPAAMRLQDALGQKTVIDFQDLKINASLDTDLFNFQPPEGVDVIRQQQQP